MVTFSFSAVITFAAYNRTTRIDQTIAVADKKGSNIYLDATEWDIDGAVFYMYVWKYDDENNRDDDTVAKKYLTPIGKTSEGYYIYNFQSTVHNRILFLRVNPTYAGNQTYFADNANAFVTGVSWNKTANRIYNSSETLCKIISAWSSETFLDGTVSTSSWSAYS